MDEEMKAIYAKDLKELAGDFCRGCGYCMPCPKGIKINNCARISQLLRRSPSANWLGEGVAGRNGKNQRMPPLWAVRFQMSLWAGHAKTFGEKSGGL